MGEVHWLNGLPHERMENAFSAMRMIREKSDWHRERYRFLCPKEGRTPVGAAHFDEHVYAETLAEVLSRLAEGKAPQEAGELAKQYARRIVATWNKQPRAASFGGKHELQRWDGMADHKIDEAVRLILSTQGET